MMDMEFILVRMVLFIKGNLKIIYLKEKDKCNGGVLQDNGALMWNKAQIWRHDISQWKDPKGNSIRSQCPQSALEMRVNQQLDQNPEDPESGKKESDSWASEPETSVKEEYRFR